MFLYQSENDSHFECPQCGQHGTVHSVSDDTVVLEVAPKMRVVFDKPAVKRKFAAGGEG